MLLYFLLKKAQIFSAGFSSGEYGGKKINPIFSGITKALDLWNAPLSRTIILNSFGFCFANSFKKIWKLFESQFGSSKRNLSPLIGEKAPNKYSVWNTWWNGHIGLTPIAVRDFPFLVNKPNLLSSPKYKFMTSNLGSDFKITSWYFWTKFF